MRKRTICVALCAAMILCLTGCHETTNIPIVARKKSAEENSAIAASTNLTIADQVHAPENYQNSLSDEKGNLNVEIDAKVILPDLEGFKVKKVERREIGEEDLEQIVKVLAPGAEIKKADQEEAAAKGMDSQIELYEFSQGEKEYKIILENRKEDPSMQSGIYFSRSSELGALTESRKKLKKKGKNLVADMGFTDFVLGGEYPFQTEEGSSPAGESILVETEEGSSADGEKAGMEPFESYTLQFTRKVDGIPITYTDGTISFTLNYSEEFMGYEAEAKAKAAENAYERWYEEKLYLMYDGQGLSDFAWQNPYRITDGSDEYVFLLPFSEIMQIFESIITGNYGDYGVLTDVKVNQIRLGYMCVMDPKSQEEGKLVPVWDFFGTVQKSIYADDGNTYPYVDTQDGLYSSLLTINAMDGTVIDRSLGY